MYANYFIIILSSPVAFTMKETRAMKDWARSLNGLWVTQPTNFMMEMVHNASMADQKPGCCVCRIFFHDKVGFLFTRLLVMHVKTRL